jgi:hypothetical protein
MACAKQYWSLAGAGLCGTGSAIGGIVSAAAQQWWLTAAAGFGLLGSIAWGISAWMDLSECLEAAGRHTEAQAAREHAHALQEEHDKLRQLLGV